MSPVPAHKHERITHRACKEGGACAVHIERAQRRGSASAHIHLVGHGDQTAIKVESSGASIAANRHCWNRDGGATKHIHDPGGRTYRAVLVDADIEISVPGDRGVGNIHDPAAAFMAHGKPGAVAQGGIREVDEAGRAGADVVVIAARAEVTGQGYGTVRNIQGASKRSFAPDLKGIGLNHGTAQHLHQSESTGETFMGSSYKNRPVIAVWVHRGLVEEDAAISQSHSAIASAIPSHDKPCRCIIHNCSVGNGQLARSGLPDRRGVAGTGNIMRDRRASAIKGHLSHRSRLNAYLNPPAFHRQTSCRIHDHGSVAPGMPADEESVSAVVH